jgi:hypothetical protein
MTFCFLSSAHLFSPDERHAPVAMPKDELRRLERVQLFALCESMLFKSVDLHDHTILNDDRDLSEFQTSHGFADLSENCDTRAIIAPGVIIAGSGPRRLT